MAKSQDYIEFEGEVIDVFPAGKFKVRIDKSEAEVMGHLSGKMRMNKINILMNDRVTIEVSAYDTTQGRITYRHK
jgi:translation initiation factor IF-1